MEKPKLQTIQFFDYYDCRNYIEKKLGIEDLQDVNGYVKVCIQADGNNCRLNYNLVQNFDEYVEYECEASDGQQFSIYDTTGSYDNDGLAWAAPIVKAFHEEFGEDAVYIKS